MWPETLLTDTDDDNNDSCRDVIAPDLINSFGRLVDYCGLFL